MSINMTLVGQMIAFTMFVIFCMKYVWPPLIAAMRERQEALDAGLQRAVEAEKQLEEANEAAAGELEEAKKQSADLIAQAQRRASQIVEEAKQAAEEEVARVKAGAEAEIEQEINRARESLRAQVGELAIEGAEKILEKTIDRAEHEEMLGKLASRL